MPPRFLPGDRVRVLDLDLTGHVRTPSYIRNHSGVIERYCGVFPNPERRAYGDADAPRKELYRVHFRLRDLWLSYAGALEDTLEIEIYEHWLVAENESAA